MVTAAMSSLLHFWFGTEGQNGTVDPAVVERWQQLGALHVPGWSASPAADDELRRAFGALLDEAESGACDRWVDTPRGRLAYIILCDQVPRSIHRGTARAFAYDARARQAAVEGLAAGDDAALGTFERAFFLMPLVHAEDPLLQAQSCALHASLAAAGAHAAAVLEIFRRSALRHRRIVEQFGRFPHRNAVLGRAPTEDERRFARDPWSWFPPEER
jgi:uncharacterized protein (DUF924 family)